MLLDFVAKRANVIIKEHSDVLSYLESRKIGDEEISKYEIGYMEYIEVAEDIIEQGEDRIILKESNNLKNFCKKIIFPLKNVFGQVIGLCLRKVTEKSYYNFFSTEAKKIGAFFGLVEALPFIKKNNRVFVHEGAINAISFATVFPESIASLTSFLSETQYEILSFLCDKIILVYDNDRSGHLGAMKVLSRYGVDGKIDTFFFEDGDANDYIKFFGKDKFKEFLKRKIPYFF